MPCDAKRLQEVTMFTPTFKRETFRRALLTSVLLLTGAGTSFADFNAGSAAFNNGNYARAYQEYKQSADAGNSVAQFMMGRLYAEGHGVVQDKATAYMWYDLSASNGNNRAIAARDAVAAQMDSGEIDHAQELATAWRADHSAASTSVAAPVMATSTTTSAPYSLINVQMALSDLGYVVGTPDGLIGPKSRAAIRAYQADSGIPTSGEPSRALYEKLQASVTQRSGQAAQPVQQPASAVSDAMITEAQTELRRRGYSISAITGSVNTETVAAVREYQSDAHLPVDGAITDALLQQLRPASVDSGAVYRAQVKQVQASLNAAGYSAGPPDGALGPKSRAAISRYQTDNRLAGSGEVNAELLASLGIQNNDATATAALSATTIRDIQQQLKAHGYASGNPNGTVDQATQDAIRAYQKDAGLEMTGRPTPELLQHLRRSDIRNGGENSTQVALPSNSVLEIQGELNRLGYLNRAGDGRMGRRSTAAIRRYQGDRGLVVDGLPSMSLLSKLRADTEPVTEPGVSGN
jgi:peptidoglycan hydrolase-like protein with peptidoglycan-binding domain